MTDNSTPAIPRVFVVRADYGKYAEAFKNGGYAAIGWLATTNLIQAKSKEKLRELYERVHPEITKNAQLGNHVGQIARFLFDIKPGDYILTPTSDTDWINCGVMVDTPYQFAATDNSCPFPHRRTVKWAKQPLKRSSFSVPLKNSIRALLTVFEIQRSGEIFEMLGKPELIKPADAKVLLMHEIVLKRILEQDAEFFEFLVADLLRAMGFDARQTGKSGDGGVDAEGVLDMDGLAQIDLKVQAKRYAEGKINASTIINFRGSIPNGSQGAFITTSGYAKKAVEASQDPKFQRVNLIDGKQLVDLLGKYWDELSPEYTVALDLQKSWVLS